MGHELVTCFERQRAGRGDGAEIRSKTGEGKKRKRENAHNFLKKA